LCNSFDGLVVGLVELSAVAHGIAFQSRVRMR
jgi:hypothetical protein